MSPGNTHPPLVSVVIPAHNYAHFIGQTLECVQAQSYTHWECLVIDDGSKDNTREVVTRYAERDDRIRYIYQSNQGSGAARNAGLRNSRGKYLQFLDADDLIEQRKLERQADYLERHAEIDIVYGGVRYFRTGHTDERLYSSWGENKPWMPEISGEGENALLTLVRTPIVILAPLTRRSVVDSVGFFDETLMPSEDWHFWIRCAAEGKRFQYEDLEGTLALVRIHSTSMTANRRQGVVNTLRMRRKVSKIITDAEALELNRRRACEEQGYAGIREVIDGNTARGVWQLFKAGASSRHAREKMKWFFCAVAAPFAPRQQLEDIASSPASQSLSSILRHRFRGAR